MLDIVLRWDEFGNILQRALKTFDLHDSILVFSRRACSIFESADDFAGEI